jgi:hypothetical protein
MKSGRMAERSCATPQLPSLSRGAGIINEKEIAMFYRLRFAFHLWWSIQDMSWREAWRYPADAGLSDGNPIEDAEAEMSYMGEG